jgi:peptidoglycan/LPS O-acetylase OafA/YrhL
MMSKQDIVERIIGALIAAVALFVLIILAIFIYKVTDQAGNEKVHSATEWQQRR